MSLPLAGQRNHRSDRSGRRILAVMGMCDCKASRAFAMVECVQPKCRVRNSGQ